MVAIRLSRTGAKKKPSYRVVVMDSRHARDSKNLEIVGHYNPRLEPIELVLRRERIAYWLGVGAQPSDTVKRLIKHFDEHGATGPEAKKAYEPSAVEKTASQIRAEMAPAPVEEPAAEGGAEPAAESAGAAEGATEVVSEPAGEGAADSVAEPTAEPAAEGAEAAAETSPDADASAEAAPEAAEKPSSEEPAAEKSSEEKSE